MPLLWDWKAVNRTPGQEIHRAENAGRVSMLIVEARFVKDPPDHLPWVAEIRLQVAGCLPGLIWKGSYMTLVASKAESEAWASRAINELAQLSMSQPPHPAGSSGATE